MKIFLTDVWVMLDGQKMLWLPRDIRSTYTAVYKSKIAIGCESGRMVFLDIKHRRDYYGSVGSI